MPHISTPHEAGAHPPADVTPVTPSPTPAPLPGAGDAIRIRPLRTNAEFQACVELQSEVWGLERAELVPATLLHVVEYVGGLAVGAFDANDQLLGFVFGITGPRDGELAHWSHMLGVRESTRDHGIGRLLKEHQRNAMRELGVRRIYWTFDPLQAKNAYFNINRLGARVDRYVPDMYGKTASPLHLGMATDRLIARIETDAGEIRPVVLDSVEGRAILTPAPVRTDSTIAPSDATPEVVLIEIPENIGAVLQQSATRAQTWRLAVRDHFQWALAKGYAVVGVHREAAQGRVFYVMTR